MSKSNPILFISIALLIVVSVIMVVRLNHTAVRSTLQPTRFSHESEAEILQNTNKSHPTEGIPLAKTTASAAVPNKPPTAERPIDIERPVSDPEFAAAAARPYVEAWERTHGTNDKLDWNQFKAVFFQAPASSVEKGYLAVFFPNNARNGFGFTCFNVGDDAQDHLKPMAWGHVPDLNLALRKLRRDATKGSFACSSIATSIFGIGSYE